MHLVDCLHEASHTHILSRLGVVHNHYGSVVHCIELSNLVGKANSFEEHLYFILWPWEGKVIL